MQEHYCRLDASYRVQIYSQMSAKILEKMNTETGVRRGRTRTMTANRFRDCMREA